jgi:hypothetical protein
VPGLLQVESYAREVIVTSGRQITEAQVEEQVQARLERQRILDKEDLAFVAIMDEGVPRRQIGEVATMRDQLRHPLEIARRPNVTIQIVPGDAGSYSGLAGGFHIAGFGGREFAYVYDVLSGDVIECVEDVEIIKRIWESLRGEALSGRQSIKLIEDVAKKWMF